MMSCRKILKVSVTLWPKNAAPLYGVCRDIVHKDRFLCTSVSMSESVNVAESTTIVESPELPDWVKYCERDSPSTAESDDDFVLPKIVDWDDMQKRQGDHSNHVKHIAGEIVDSDLNKVCDVLKESFVSPDAVVAALSSCEQMELNESLEQKILLRYRHDWIHAFGFFKWAKGQTGYMHTAKCYDSMVDILGMSRRFELMWELVEEMDIVGGLISLHTMTVVMRRLCRCRNYDEAVEAFNKFGQFRVLRKTAAMNTLLETLVKERNVERAQTVYLDFKHEINPNDRTFNTLIHGWCKAGKLDQARQVMEEMKKYGYEPDVISYTCLVEYFCRKKDFRKVDEILDEMQEKGCSPNVVTYTIVLHALGKAKEISQSLEIYEKMKESGCLADANFYSALIFSLSNSGRFKDACDLFEDMPKQNIAPNVLTYNAMISAACMHSREDYALELLKDMESKSCRPDLKTYTPLLKKCCEKKRMKVLNYLLADMFRKNVSLDLSTYCLMVDRLCKNGKLEHACSVFEQMVLKGMVPRRNTYALLMEGLEQRAMKNAKQQIEKLMLQANYKPS